MKRKQKQLEKKWAKEAKLEAEKEAQLLGSTKEAIALRRAEIDGEIKLNKANKKFIYSKIRNIFSIF